MKTTASKENSTSSQSSQPFFNKKGEGSFLSSTKEVEQPFFSPNSGIQRNPVSSSYSGGHNFANIPIFSPCSQPVIQTKLTINEPGDKYEQEADAMADRVMRMSAPVSESGDESMVQTKPLNINAVQRKCAACEEEEKVQRQEMEEDETLKTKPLMRKAESGGYSASPQLSSQLNSSKGGGDPLPSKTLASMNHAFGADFSTVRVHTGSQAAEMSQGIQAKAFTHRSDVYFNQGQYNPESSGGKRLLAHELMHVVQQVGRQNSAFTKTTGVIQLQSSSQRDDACSTLKFHKEEKAKVDIKIQEIDKEIASVSKALLNAPRHLKGHLTGSFESLNNYRSALRVQRQEWHRSMLHDVDKCYGNDIEQTEEDLEKSDESDPEIVESPKSIFEGDGLSSEEEMRDIVEPIKGEYLRVAKEKREGVMKVTKPIAAVLEAMNPLDPLNITVTAATAGTGMVVKGVASSVKAASEVRAVKALENARRASKVIEISQEMKTISIGVKGWRKTLNFTNKQEGIVYVLKNSEGKVLKIGKTGQKQINGRFGTYLTCANCLGITGLTAAVFTLDVNSDRTIESIEGEVRKKFGSGQELPWDNSARSRPGSGLPIKCVKRECVK